MNLNLVGTSCLVWIFEFWKSKQYERGACHTLDNKVGSKKFEKGDNLIFFFQSRRY